MPSQPMSDRGERREAGRGGAEAVVQVGGELLATAMRATGLSAEATVEDALRLLIITDMLAVDWRALSQNNGDGPPR